MTRTRLQQPLVLAFVLAASAAAKAERPEFSKVDGWAYQLTGYEDDALLILAEAPVDLLVIDLTRDGERDHFRRAEVQALQAADKHVLAYFEIGAIERFRPEWDSVPEDLKAGPVSGWEDEQYVRYWDERWWPIVRDRVDQAIAAGFDGAYLDMLTTYEEIPDSSPPLPERAERMVGLVVRLSEYAKRKEQDFKVVPQNCPELAWGLEDDTMPNKRYLAAIDGTALESPFYLAHGKRCRESWCGENRANALRIKKHGKLLLGVDYVKQDASRTDAYRRQRQAGFVPYASVEGLDRYVPEIKTEQ